MNRTAAELFDDALGGSVPAMSRLISKLERGDADVEAVWQPIHARGGRARVIGITGPPGTGKSTLVSSLVSELRRREATVAVVAVDPSSAITGGAILGDRIRMHDHTLDHGVYVRSLASRGRLGGISRATADTVAVLDACGWEVIIVETVGVGQAEVEIVQLAHTVAVVSVPGLGDDVQAIKAGLMEIADIHIVNKADRPGANKVVAELQSMLHLAPARPWTVPVIETVALTGAGVPELADTIARHGEFLRESGALADRERTASTARVRAIAQEMLAQLIDTATSRAAVQEVFDAVGHRTLDPHAAALMLIEHHLRRPE